MLSFSIYAVYCALIFSLTSAFTPVDYTVRTAPGTSVKNTYKAVRRAISEAAVEKRDATSKNSTILDRSWDGTVLLKISHEQPIRETNQSSLVVTAGIEVVCTKCYIKGIATAEISIDDGFNGSLALKTISDDVLEEVRNITESVDDYFLNYTLGVIDNFEDGIDLSDFAMPTINYTFDIDVPTIPECKLRFQFDDMEIYMMVDTVLSLGATYQLNLYSSTTPLGISLTKDLEVGIIFSVDLILSVEGQIDISSGFHLKLDDGVAIEIALFGDDISNIIFNGGQFEFLPVTIESAGVVFSAILRIGIHAGFQLVTPDLSGIEILGQSIPAAGGGIEVGVFANVAEFITNVTFAPEEDCKLKVVQSYQMALGAVAGATVAIGTNTWGPMVATSVPIWYTELAEGCAIQKTPTAVPTVTATPAAEKRQDLNTFTTEVTYTGVHCETAGLVNCPASAQITSRTVSIITTTVTDSEFTFPATVQNTVLNTVAFGSNAVSLPATTGIPVSYVPPPPQATAQDEEDDNDNNDGKDNSLPGKVGGVDKKVVLGVSLGVGVPVLITIIAGIIFLVRRRQYIKVAKVEAVTTFAEPYGHGHGNASGDIFDKRNKAGVRVTEVES